MKRIKKFLAGLALSVGVISCLALPAEAQAGYNINTGYVFQNNPCRINYSHYNSGASTIGAWMRNVYNYPTICWIQMKVSYWNTYGTWIIWNSQWIGATPENGYFPMATFQGQQAIWYVDYNTNWGGNIQGIRSYAPGCNASGC